MPLSEPMLEYCQCDTKEEFSMEFLIEIHTFSFQNAFENLVWKMVVILSRPQCFNQFLVDSCHLFTPYFARLLDD